MKTVLLCLTSRDKVLQDPISKKLGTTIFWRYSFISNWLVFLSKIAFKWNLYKVTAKTVSFSRNIHFLVHITKFTMWDHSVMNWLNYSFFFLLETHFRFILSDNSWKISILLMSNLQSFRRPLIYIGECAVVFVRWDESCVWGRRPSAKNNQVKIFKFNLH